MLRDMRSNTRLHGNSVFISLYTHICDNYMICIYTCDNLSICSYVKVPPKRSSLEQTRSNTCLQGCFFHIYTDPAATNNKTNIKPLLSSMKCHIKYTDTTTKKQLLVFGVEPPERNTGGNPQKTHFCVRTQASTLPSSLLVYVFNVCSFLGYPEE